MSSLRNITPEEISSAEAFDSSAEDWSQVFVSEDFSPHQLLQSRLEGRVELGSGARIVGSRIRNYRLGEGVVVEQTTALECRERSTFGNGTPVAAMNENGGRTVCIFAQLSAQIAYLSAVYRHRPQLIAALDRMAAEQAEAYASELGYVGKNSRIVGAGFIREAWIGDRVQIDGASIVQNATLLDGAIIGVGVKAYDLIAAEGAVIGNGSIAERCFVGEACRIDKGFTAVDSLFFANSHCENGEAASIFAGPYTVTHHKSTLLIAGMFSFFNAGSGSNQSNHLFKSGAVHQSAHLRGCKFASSAYVMSPALEGPFTMVMGSHSYHHDTSTFPYSYLIEKNGRSHLMPGANLTSYGTLRDIEKWPARDKRALCRDVINFEEYNPYLCGLLLRGVDALQRLAEEEPDTEYYNYHKVLIRNTSLRRGIELYNRAIVASLGAMLTEGAPKTRYDGNSRWLDIAGQYITKRETDAIAEAIERGELTSPQTIDNRFRIFHVHYADYARSWAEGVLAELLGHAPSQEELSGAIQAGKRAQAALQRTREADRERDFSAEMAVGYGLDCDTEEEIMNDYRTVRGINI